MLDSIENNSIIICNKDAKNQILRRIKKLINIKFMSIKEFIKSYYFDYDEKSILYLMKKYNIKYEIAVEYLSNLIYVEDKKYNNDKLDFLVSIKKTLMDNNLLIFNNKFKNYIKDKKIVIYNYHLTKFERYLLRDLDIKEINKPQNSYKPVIYEFKNVDEEVEFVAKEISKLINSKVPVDQIKLVNIGDDYINIVTRIFGYYNLMIDKFNKISILSTVIGKKFYDNLNNGINFACDSICKYSDTKIYKQIIDICNKYIWCDDINDARILIEYDLKHTYIENTKYKNMIEVVDLKTYDFNNEYVFMLGFNQGIIPNLQKDEDYITDSIKPYYMDSTVEKNKKEREEVLNSIRNIKNLTITYKLKSPFRVFYPSNLIDELGVNVSKSEFDCKVSYSRISDSLRLASALDELIKFSSIDDTLEILNSNYDIPYNTYSHSFTGLSKKKLEDYINSQENFNLSYSSMDNYNRCAFRFYIDKILCLKDNNEKFSLILGKIYHYILEKAVKQDIDIEYEVKKYIEENKIDLSNSNNFFISKCINNLKYLIEILKYQSSFSKLKNIDTEKFIKVPLKDNINFVGFIDKIVYDKIDNQTVAAIIDYKTYVKSPSLKFIENGIDIQLPTYMYLSSYLYKNIKFAGFYLQNITLDNKSDDEKKDSLKLIGFTNKDKKILEMFDSGYTNSSVINGIKVKQDGSFSANSLKYMLSDEDINNIIDITKTKIDETLDNILNCNFDINPKINKDNLGCEFCNFSDLCYKKEYDLKYIDSSEKFNITN